MTNQYLDTTTHRSAKKKTKLAAGLLVGTGLLFGATAVAGSDCTADSDDNGIVDILDLLNTIDQWGVCDPGMGNDVVLQWLKTEYEDATNLPAQTCVSKDGKHISLQNVASGGVGRNFHMQPSTLFNGPTHVTDKLKIAMTIDLSNYRNPEPNGYATPAIFLCGYGNVLGTATEPSNTGPENTWYYADAANHADPALSCEPSPTFTSQLDLFEIGCAKIPGQDGLMNIMQMTSHPFDSIGAGAGQDQWGSYIGLRNDDIADFTNACSPWSAQLLTCEETGENHIGLDMTKPFSMEYTIFQGGMDIEVTQPLNTSFGSKTIQMRGSPGPAGNLTPGIADFLRYQMFSIVASINNNYGPASGDFCHLEKYGNATFPYGSWTADFTSLQYMDGTAEDAEWIDCIPVQNSSGVPWEGGGTTSCTPGEVMPECTP